MRPILALTGVVGGVLTIFAGRIYQGAVHPEWSEMGALIQLWWVWLLGAALILVGLTAVGADGRRKS
jgi:hypothetical protein